MVGRKPKRWIITNKPGSVSQGLPQLIERPVCPLTGALKWNVPLIRMHYQNEFVLHSDCRRSFPAPLKPFSVSPDRLHLPPPEEPEVHFKLCRKADSRFVSLRSCDLIMKSQTEKFFFFVRATVGTLKRVCVGVCECVSLGDHCISPLVLLT